MAPPPPLVHRGFQQQAKRLAQRVRGKRFLHFLHIGKTGGSAVKHALEPYVEGRRWVLYLQPHLARLEDVPRGEGVMFLVRDPMSRFVSAFFSRQRQGKPLYFSPWKPEEQRAFETFETPNDLATSLSSADAARRARATEAMKSIRHLKSSYWEWFKDEAYFASRTADIFFIGFQETLSTDFETLKRMLDLPDDARLPDDDVGAHRNPVHVDKKLGPEAVENLKNWYKRDFEFVATCRELAARQQPGGTRRVA